MNWQRIQVLATKSVPYLTLIFLFLVALLLYQGLSNIKWEQMALAFDQVTFRTVLLALLVVLINHTLFSSYDYLSSRHLDTQHVSQLKIMLSAFVSYIFNFNLGSLVGGIGFRYRLYSGWKISKRKISLIILFSGTTTWMGYAALLGVINFIGVPDQLIWPKPSLWLRFGLAPLALCLPALYFYCCLTQKTVRFKQRTFKLPTGKIAALQLFFSMTQWCLPAVIITLFLKQFNVELNFQQVLWTYILAAVAALITHIPAGLGVLEAIFLKMHDQIEPESLLAALLCFRAFYYLLPLALAIPTYLYLEYYQKKSHLIHDSTMQKSA